MTERSSAGSGPRTRHSVLGVASVQTWLQEAGVQPASALAAQSYLGPPARTMSTSPTAPPAVLPVQLGQGQTLLAYLKARINTPAATATAPSLQQTLNDPAYNANTLSQPERDSAIEHAIGLSHAALRSYDNALASAEEATHLVAQHFKARGVMIKAGIKSLPAQLEHAGHASTWVAFTQRLVSLVRAAQWLEKEEQLIWEALGGAGR